MKRLPKYSAIQSQLSIPIVPIRSVHTDNVPLATIQFSLNVFTEFAEFCDQNICHHSKRV